ncbi:hybrid sensor histidine kinase/response regulator [Capnocytophaga sp. HP1101]
MKKLFYIVFVLLSVAGSAQDLAYLSKITTHNGLVSNEVTSMLQDSKGFIWIGTDDGLHKFDGYDITVYKHNAQAANSIGGNSIRCLFEDRHRNLWIGLKGEGLCQLNLRTGAFKTYKHQKGANSLCYNDVAAIVEDEAGMIWIAVDRGGLDMLNPQTDTFTHYDIQDKNTSQPLNNALTGMVATNGTLVLSSWGGGVYTFNRKEKQFKLHPYWQTTATDEQVCKHIFNLYKDSEGNVWVSSAHGGLYSLDEKKKHYQRYTVCNAPNCSHNVNVRSVANDNQGKLWIETSEGIKLLNKHTRTITDLPNPQLANESVNHIYRDKSQLMWVSTASGIYYFSPTPAQFKWVKYKNFLSEKQVRTIFKDSKGNLWIGGLNHIDKLSPDRKSLQAFSNQNYNPNTQLYQAFCEDKEGNIWIGNYANYLVKYSPQANRFSEVPIPAPAGTNYTYRNVYQIAKDWDNSFWLATELGAMNYQPATGVFSPLFESGNIIYPEDKTHVVYRDQDLLLWVGTEKGLRCYTRDLKLKHTFTALKNDPHALSNDFITAIHESKDGTLWIGTKGGLHKFDKKAQHFELILRKGNDYGDPIFGLAEDSRGNLWMSTPSAILKYTPQNKQFQVFNEYDGLQNSGFELGAFAQAKDSELLIGGKDGFNTFYPERLTLNQTQPKVVISDFQIFNKSVRPEEGGVLTKVIDETQSIHLKHWQSVISFRFSALNYRASFKNQYAYMLEGFDNDWIYDTSERIATYTNLNPGTYVFKVKATNNDGVWSQQPTTIKLIVAPPLWRTTWAYMLYALLAIGLLVLIVKYYTIKERDKQNLRISQLEAQRMYEINEMKTNFFSNISHEFKTPLSLIVGPLNQMVDDENSPKQHKEKYTMMLRNAQKLMRLINQLLDFRKLEKNKLELNLQYDDVVKFVKGVCETFGYLALEKQIQYTIKSTVPSLWMPFDADKLDKILYNLIGNAFQYTPEKGAITVLISTAVQQEQKYLQIKIADTGIGISQEEQQQLFTAFLQGKRQKEIHNEGAGLGLAFTKDLVDLHKGHIEVESEEQQGATFTVFLPILDVPQLHDEASITLQQIDVSQTAKETPPEEATTDKEESILVVEDNEDMRNYIQNILSEHYHVLLARDGEEGLELAIAHIPDLIVSDIMMPKRDGISMVKELCANEKTNHIPIILLTALDKESQVVEGYSLGVEDYITKPFSAKILSKRIENILLSRKKLWEQYSSSPNLNVYREKLVGQPWKKEFVDKISNIVMEHLSDPEFSIDALAFELNMSTNQLFKKVKAIMNTTPYNVIVQIRMTAATELMKQGNLNISEVAYKVGYQELSNFSRSFKKFYNVSPREYLKNKSEK